MPSTMVNSGGHVTLQCVSQWAYNMLILMKEEEKSSSVAYIQNKHTGSSSAQFTLGPVAPNQSGRFTCYGSFLNSSQLWSVPSNHLDLLVSGKKAVTFTLNDITTETSFQVRTWCMLGPCKKSYWTQCHRMYNTVLLEVQKDLWMITPDPMNP